MVGQQLVGMLGFPYSSFYLLQWSFSLRAAAAMYDHLTEIYVKNMSWVTLKYMYFRVRLLLCVALKGH